MGDAPETEMEVPIGINMNCARNQWSEKEGHTRNKGKEEGNLRLTTSLSPGMADPFFFFFSPNKSLATFSLIRVLDEYRKCLFAWKATGKCVCTFTHVIVCVCL